MAIVPDKPKFKHPVSLLSKDFQNNKLEFYAYLREESPVYRTKLFGMNMYLLSRYDDCTSILKSPHVFRNRSTARGKGGRFPFPVPRTVQLLMKNMITEDTANHDRLRGFVQKAFTPRAIENLREPIRKQSNALLDIAERQGTVDLKEVFALPLPVSVIAGMVGVPDEDTPVFRSQLKVLTDGMSGWNILRTFAWDLRKLVDFTRDMIKRKRANPGDDIFTELIQMEEEGDRLSEDELVGMLFLLIFAGYETTVHLISNSVLALLQHPDELQRLRENPEMIDSAVEELLRYAGPIHGTKPNYPDEDMEFHGTTIPTGAMIMPLLGAANFDSTHFEDPNRFDLTRSPNRHLAFGFGPHVCLGASLARMETKVALTTLIERNPNLRLAVDPNDLQLERLPAWHRYKTMPVVLG